MLRRLAILATLLVALGAAAGALAFEVDKPLDDPVLEARAKTLAEQLRCLVCQNQSIAESNASLARDLRQIVRERLVAGDSDQEVIDYLVQRYGDWVLLEPPFKVETVILWLGPLAILLVALGVAGMAIRRRRRRDEPATAPLSDGERERLEALLSEGSES